MSLRLICKNHLRAGSFGALRDHYPWCSGTTAKKNTVILIFNQKGEKQRRQVESLIRHYLKLRNCRPVPVRNGFLDRALNLGPTSDVARSSM
ncbi:unnamed protein product [Sphenostylis stenocarpa]|uniref:Uncharacterized protein n=1 Tax=Sphenostylis stenocarpa TaxID=92480 RepID=A0AA86V536_9FABA|nr:unnamed protein product [Sphenostylis stenocarpa]